MRRSVALLLFSLLPPPSAAAKLALPPPAELHALDTLRAIAVRSYASDDHTALTQPLRELLRREPGDGCALRLLALSANRDPGDATLARALAAAKPVVLGDVVLDRASASFLRGLRAYYADRNATALRELDAALRARPGWGWAHLYRARARAHLALPLAQVEADFARALADPSSRPAAVVSAAWSALGGSVLTLDRPPGDWIAWTRTVPWTRPDAEELSLEWAITSGGRVTPASLGVLWSDLRTRWPWPDERIVDVGAGWAARFESPREAIAFLEAREVDGPSPWVWRVRRAGLAMELMRPEDAEALLRGAPSGSTTARCMRLQLGLAGDAPIASLRALADSMRTASLGMATVSAVRGFLQQIADSTALRELESEWARENRGVALASRFARLLRSDVDAAAALLDSLGRAGSSFESLRTNRLELREARGDTVGFAEFDGLPPLEASDLALRLADVCESRGDRARSGRLLRWSESLWSATVAQHAQRAWFALAAGARSEALEHQRRVEQLAPGEPITVIGAAAFGHESGNREPAVAIVRAALFDPASPASLLAMLVQPALQMGRAELADSLAQRAVQLAPGRRDVRAAHAMAAMGNNDRATALAVVEGLYRETPGNEALVALRHVLDASAATARQRPVTPPSGRFDDARDDLRSPAALRALAAQTDTMRRQSTALLLWRDDIACERPESFAIRTHVAARALDRDGVNELRTYRIQYEAGGGPPAVLTARVIQPDGRVQDVPLGDIVHASGDSEDADATDNRAVVIPFPGLRVGSIIDVAWESTQSSAYSNGYAFTRPLVTTGGALVRVLELKTRDGLDVRSYSGASAPEPDVHREGSYTWRTWRLAKATTREGEPAGPPDWEWRPWVGISTFASWGAAMREYVPLFWQRATADDAIRRLTAERTRGVARVRGRIDALLAYMAEHVNYTSIEIGVGQIVPSAAAEVMGRSHGDCKDMTALFIAMLDACGVPAQPLLVSTDGESPLLDELPDPSAFTHMLVMIPDGGDTLYADPTMQRPGLATVPRWIAGQRALTFDRNGTVRMVRIPRPAAEEQGVHAALELQPTEGNTARIVVRMRLRGQFVGLISDVLERRDTTQVASGVRRVLGYGLWESCRLVGWNVDERTPERLVLSATFQDTAWAADPDRVLFQWTTEVADLFTDYPDTTGRRSDVLFERAFSDTVIVRLRDGAGWRVSRNIAGLPVQGDGYAGSFGVQARADGVEIVQRFEVRTHRMPPAAYAEFYRDWRVFSAFVSQTYEYQRALDDAQVAQMQDYGRRNPDDASFALQSVLRLLGSALGGVGDEGRHRRDAIRALLKPLLTTGVHDSRLAAMVFTCAIEMREGRYRRSDSLIAVARSLSPGNARVMQLAIASKLELGDQAGALAVMKTMSGGGAGADLSLEMLRLCTFLGLADEARAAEQRYFLLHPDPDSTAVLTVRLSALVDSYRCDAAREMLVRLSPRLPRADRLAAEGRLEHTCGRPDLAVPMLEEAWLVNPTNVVAANNYAWSCALAGVKLQRAEQLARTVLAMSPNADAIANTLGTVLLRLGRVTEAEALFRSLLDRDDRPWNTASNEYFVGLCEYRTGRQADAKARWIRLLDAQSSPRTREWLRQSLAATERGADPEDALFRRGPAVR